MSGNSLVETLEGKTIKAFNRSLPRLSISRHKNLTHPHYKGHWENTRTCSRQFFHVSMSNHACNVAKGHKKNVWEIIRCPEYALKCNKSVHLPA